MTWNFDGVNGIPDTAAGWVQTTGYTDVVTFPIVYSGTFTNVTVNGDVASTPEAGSTPRTPLLRSTA